MVDCVLRWYEPEVLLCPVCGFVSSGVEGRDCCPACGSDAVVGCGPVGGF